MNAEVLPHDTTHRLGEHATHPRQLFLNTLAALQTRTIVDYGAGLRLAMALKNSALGRVQLPNLG